MICEFAVSAFKETALILFVVSSFLPLPRKSVHIKGASELKCQVLCYT